MEQSPYSPAEEAEFLSSPALRIRKAGYPEDFQGKVPRLIKPRWTVRSDIPFLAPGVVAREANVYLAWTNSYGAVAAILPGKGNLGLKPDEFEVIEWANPATLPIASQPNG